MMVDELNAQSRQASSRQNLTVRRKAADALDCTWYQFVRVSAASCRFLDSSPHAIDAVSANRLRLRSHPFVSAQRLHLLPRPLNLPKSSQILYLPLPSQQPHLGPSSRPAVYPFSPRPISPFRSHSFPRFSSSQQWILRSMRGVKERKQVLNRRRGVKEREGKDR
jgi:hypothetical protein